MNSHIPIWVQIGPPPPPPPPPPTTHTHTHTHTYTQCLIYDFHLVLGVGQVTDRDASVLARLLASTCILKIP